MKVIEVMVGILVFAVIILVSWIVGNFVETGGNAEETAFLGACVIFLLSFSVVGLYSIGSLVLGAVR